MGWTSFATERTPAEEIRQMLTGPKSEVIRMEDCGAVVYAAVRDPDGVRAVVTLVEHRGAEPRRPGRKPARTYAFKTMGESEGPFYYGASRELLSILTAPCRGGAARWRAKCWERVAGVNQGIA